MPVIRHVTSRVEHKDSYMGGDVLLPICMRSPNVQGRNFVAMLEAVAGFAPNVFIVMCDYLDRYNLSGGEEALELSSQWQDENLKEVARIFPHYNFIDWREIMNEMSFNARHEELKRLYQINMDVKKAIDINVDHYVRPQVTRLIQKHGWDVDPTPIYENSKNYLIEEYAGTAIYKNLVPSATQVYWGVYIEDTEVFSRHSVNDLSLPVTLPVANNRLGRSIVSISEISYLKAA